MTSSWLVFNFEVQLHDAAGYLILEPSSNLIRYFYFLAGRFSFKVQNLGRISHSLFHEGIQENVKMVKFLCVKNGMCHGGVTMTGLWIRNTGAHCTLQSALA